MLTITLFGIKPLLMYIWGNTSQYGQMFEAGFVMFILLSAGYLGLVYQVWKVVKGGGGGDGRGEFMPFEAQSA